MAATTNVNPRRGGTAAMTVNEVARLRAAVQTLADLVITGGLMEAAELAELIGEDLMPAEAEPATIVNAPPLPAVMAQLGAPLLPPPAPSVAVLQAAAARTVAQAAFAPHPTPPSSPELDAHAIAAALSGEPVPSLKSPSVWSRLFGRRKTSPAAVAKVAASIEFTERMPKLPFGDKDGLYADAQRPTELSFPPTPKRQRSRTPARSRSAAVAAHATSGERARFCERCWRRVDADGECLSCGPSA
jgi:hypothetical protein